MVHEKHETFVAPATDATFGSLVEDHPHLQGIASDRTTTNALPGGNPQH